MQVKKQGLEPNRKMDWFRIRKSVNKAVYCHPSYLTYIQSILCEVLGWINHKLDSDSWEKYQCAQICT